jgi:transcriptional regulator with XRE-family HTH domain
MLKKKHTIQIHNLEAEKIRQRLDELNLTQTALAEKLGISLRYLGKILSLTKDKPVSVDKTMVDKLLEYLNIGSSLIFKDLKYQQEEERYLYDLFKKWKCTFLYNIMEYDDYDNYSKDETLKKTNFFAHTLIGKNIADNHPSIKDFFEKRIDFSAVPKQGYWRKFNTSPDKIRDSYILFTIRPKKPLSHFKIAYTIKSDITNTISPNQIKIIYAEIECKEDCICVTQYYSNPGHYKIKNSTVINVMTWIDKMEHDFIVMCNDDFDLDYCDENIKTKPEARALFYRLEAVLFERHSFFQRDDIYEIGDDAYFFWRNENFLNFNPEIKKQIVI